MIISQQTLTILKAFANINPSLVFREGNVQTTISPTKTILAKATTDVFPKSVAIYDLGRWINTLGLLSNPDVTFNENSCKIVDVARSVTYHYSDKSAIVCPPDKDIVLPSVEAVCTITGEQIQKIMKALSVLGVPDIAITGSEGVIQLTAFDQKNTTHDKFSIDIGSTDKTFNAVLRSENIKIIPGDYNVELAKGLAKFNGASATFWIALEASSTF